jgi:hypothetical protein
MECPVATEIFALRGAHYPVKWTYLVWYESIRKVELETQITDKSAQDSTYTSSHRILILLLGAHAR